MQRRIRERMHEAGRATDAPREVRAVVEPEDDHYALSFCFQGGVRRRIVAPTCEELVEALVWLVAIGGVRREGRVAEEAAQPHGELSANPKVVEGEPVAQPAAEAPAKLDAGKDVQPIEAPATEVNVQDPASAKAAVVPPTALVPRHRLPWFRISLGGGVWSDRLPKPQAQLQVGAGLGLGVFYLELRFSHLFESSARFAEDRRVSVRGEALTLLGCTLFRAGRRARIGPCLQATGMRSAAAAHGTSSPERGTYNWPLAGASAQVAVMLWGPFALIAELGLVVPIAARPRFSVTGHGEVARAARLAESSSLAIGAHW